MARHRDDPFHVPASDEERRLRRHLANAFAFERTETHDGVRIRFQNARAMQDFFDSVVRMGDRGYELGAELFAERVKASDPGREVRSTLLTQFALALREMEHDAGRRPVRESEVAHAGRFVNAIIASMPQAHVEWAEDMDEGCPASGLERQPTAVIRGIFLSPSLDQRRAAKFWQLAAESQRFPFAIFTAPCRSEEGTILTPWHMRAIAFVFGHAPKEAVELFAGIMRIRATWKAVKVRTIDDHGCDRWVDEVREATEADRKNVFSSIAGGIESPERRSFVSGIFGIES